MFGLCGCFRSRRDHIDRKSPHYDEVQKTRNFGINAVSEEEQVMLELIYSDLAARNHDNMLTY